MDDGARFHARNSCGAPAGNAWPVKDTFMSDTGKKQLVPIQINRESYESPNPTTGHHLYGLGNIGGGHNELFREDEGAEKDMLVPDDDTVVHLQPQEHFYSQRDWKIIVNG